MAETYPVVGIDFGTSNSVCFIFSKGAPECVKFNYQLFTPSCYSFRDGDEHYGKAAKNLMDKYPESVIYDMKRYIGKHEYEFREMFDHFHYLFSLHENGKGQLYYSHPDPKVKIHRVFASAVVSKLYSYIIDKAREQLGQEVEYGVITVPAYFSDQQIDILKKAAQIAGLRQLDVIPEPTAAALAYGISIPNSKLVIYDLGGGTFDVCILEVTLNDGYKVIKCGGDPFLGGRDFDQCMIELIKRKLNHLGVDVNALTNSQLAYLQSQAEAAKIALSVKGVIHATVSLNESFGGIEEVYIQKEEFDSSIRDLMVYALRAAGFSAVGCADGEEFWQAMHRETPELVILDIMLPGEDGISILKKLRAAPVTADIPVIMATAKGTEYDRVIGLDLGADDYLTKPFGMMEMVSRIRAVLRRAGPKSAPAVLRQGSILMDEGRHVVEVNGTPVTLTLKEYDLLRLLLENPGQVFSRDRLLSAVWGTDYYGETRTVDVHIGTLRTKLGAAGDILQTVRGVGYKLEAAHE